jgi:hypothetical protein
MERTEIFHDLTETIWRPDGNVHRMLLQKRDLFCRLEMLCEKLCKFAILDILEASVVHQSTANSVIFDTE